MRKTDSRSFWLIVKHRTGGMEVLRTTLASGAEAVAVFGFEEEARMFLELGTSGGGWRVRETTAGELVSVLLGPCSSVDRVVLDPLPGPFAETLMLLASTGRKAFVERCLNDEKNRRRPPVRGVAAGEPRGRPRRPSEGQPSKGESRYGAGC